tara:strand:- start:4200 stop:5147 length:948 start_codon:yes stop_codon:yes gene_type:complete
MTPFLIPQKKIDEHAVYTQLVEASRQGKDQYANTLNLNFPFRNLTPYQNLTPAGYVAFHNEKKAVQWWINQGASIGPMLKGAALGQHFELVIHLLSQLDPTQNHRHDLTMGALGAAQAGALKILKWILFSRRQTVRYHYSDVREITRIAAVYGQFYVVQYLLKQERALTAIQYPNQCPLNLPTSAVIGALRSGHYDLILTCPLESLEVQPIIAQAKALGHLSSDRARNTFFSKLPAALAQRIQQGETKAIKRPTVRLLPWCLALPLVSGCLVLAVIIASLYHRIKYANALDNTNNPLNLAPDQANQVCLAPYNHP